jgi:cyclopropane fatty-acyl-phospholipid synthase-like methyltransferase
MVLEIGSGSGRDANFMLNNGLDVIGIDGSEAMIKSAINNYPNLKGKLIQSVLPNLFPSFDFKFDGFYSIGTLMHFNAIDISIILNKTHSVLNANSPVYISVSEKRSEIDERYFIGFSKADWINIFEKNDFRINEIIESSDTSNRKIIWYSFLMETL